MVFANQTPEPQGALMEKPSWALAMRPLPDGRVLAVIPLTYERARLTVSTRSEWELEGYYDAW